MKPSFKLSVFVLTAAAITGCADTLKDVNKGLADMNQALASVAGSAGPRSASAPRSGAYQPELTQMQKEQISQELQKKGTDKRVNTMISEAAPAIKAVLEKRACNSEATLGIYTAPGREIVGLLPMFYTPYHNKAACLSVARVHGWSARALNALAFEVVYLADDSGETIKQTHEVVKQPDGAWLFTR